jgi:hypothetical protein
MYLGSATSSTTLRPSSDSCGACAAAAPAWPALPGRGCVRQPWAPAWTRARGMHVRLAQAGAHDPGPTAVGPGHPPPQAQPSPAHLQHKLPLALVLLVEGRAVLDGRQPLQRRPGHLPEGVLLAAALLGLHLRVELLLRGIGGPWRRAPGQQGAGLSRARCLDSPKLPLPLSGSACSSPTPCPCPCPCRRASSQGGAPRGPPVRGERTVSRCSRMRVAGHQGRRSSPASSTCPVSATSPRSSSSRLSSSAAAAASGSMPAGERGAPALAPGVAGARPGWLDHPDGWCAAVRCGAVRWR